MDKKLLKYILDYHFGGKNFENRITIFRAQSGLKLFLKYIVFILFINIIHDIKNKTWLNAFKSIPFHILTKYLVVYERYSYPNKTNSYTYFRCSDFNKQPNSVVDKCYKEGIIVSVSTINIKDIKLSYTFEKLNQDDQSKVRKYMQDTYMNDYTSLINLNRRSNNLYAIPLTSQDENVWGVMVIDNVGNQKLNFKKLIGNDIDKYQKIISLTLSSIK